MIPDNADTETLEILASFSYEHLPERLQKVSRPFNELAAQILVLCKPNLMRKHALLTLLQAKDSAVRSIL